MKYKDFLGNDIKVGDTIVYPLRSGSWMRLRKGVVRKRTKTQDYYSAVELSVSVPALMIEVESTKWDTVRRESIPTTRVVPFRSLDRCVVIGR
jgi:hypothetical protein